MLPVCTTETYLHDQFSCFPKSAYLAPLVGKSSYFVKRSFGEIKKGWGLFTIYSGKSVGPTVAVNCTRQIPNGIFSGMHSFHFHDFFPQRSKTKGPEQVKTSKWNAHFPRRKFRLEILVYLSRNPVFPRKFPFGETKLIFPFLHPIRKFQSFGKMVGKYGNCESTTFHDVVHEVMK